MTALDPAAPDLVTQWANRISGAWRENVEGIFQVGRLLADAHKDLHTTPTEWAQLTGRGKHQQRLPFKWRAAERLKCIGTDQRLVSYTTQLPPDWMAIYLITTLGDEELQRAADSGVVNPAMTQAKVRSFKRLLREEKARAGIVGIVPNYKIHHCAIENVSSDLVADASVDAIITDPPYPPEFLPTFSHLTEFAQRTLKPSGWCIVMTGAIYLPGVISRLSAKLEYRWQYIVITPGGANARISGVGLFQGYKPVLLFQKPPLTKIREWWSDVITAKASEQDKSLHPWQQSQTVFAELINRFSLPGNLIADPFAGSGTTGRAAIAQGRHFWGCDIDARCTSDMLRLAS